MSRHCTQPASIVKRLLAMIFGVALLVTALPVTTVKATGLTPEILTIGPNIGTTTGGEIVTITGRDFDQVIGGAGDHRGDYVGVFFNDVPARIVTKTSTAMTVVAPRNIVGAVDVMLRTAVLDVVRTAGYTYQAPTITSVTPSAGPTAGGTRITITGTGFGFSSSDSPARGSYATAGPPAVTIGGVAATTVVRTSPTEITAVTPAVLAGSKDVVVTMTHSSGGPVTITSAGGFTYVLLPSAPQIFSVSPSKGPTSGGQTIVLNGANLIGSNTIRATVTIGGVATTVASVTPDGKTLTATTPPGTLGKVNVVAATSDGRATLVGGYEYGRTPTIAAVTPASGPVRGATAIRITGDGFGTAGTPQVTVGGIKALCVKRESDSVVTAVTPPSISAVGANDVVVSPDTGGGSATSAGGFSYVAATAIPSLAVLPFRGPVDGGTAVTITGTNFGETGTPTVLFESECATDVIRVSPTQITAVTPRGKSGLTVVNVTTAAGALNAAGAYDYTEILRVVETGTSNTFGPTSGGLPVTITGRGFGSTGTPTVSFGGVAATNVIRTSDGLLTAVTPPGSAGAKTVVITPAITDGGLAISKSSSFTYRAPTITFVTPGAGVRTGGETIEIVGTGFGFSGTPSVTVGGQPATSVVRSSSIKLTAVTPAGALGLVNVVVTPTLGVGSATAVNAYEYVDTIRTPLVDEVSPRRGPNGGGTSLTIAGEHFLGSANTGVTVTLGGIVISGVTVSADGKSLIFATPAMSAGLKDLRIKTNEGEVIYRNAFYAAPASSFGGGVNPCSVVSPRVVNYTGSNSVTISGSGFKDSEINTHPSVTVSGTTAVVTASTDTSITFTVPNVVSGTHNIVVTPNNGGASSTLTGCFSVIRYLNITAQDKSINVGEPSPAFTFSSGGLISPDSVGSVTYTFTGTGATSYGPSQVAPTAVGVYAITPSAAVFSAGSADRYSIQYFPGTFTIIGISATVEAEDKIITYGDSSPTFTSFAGGLTSGDVLNTVSYEFEGRAGTSYGRSTTVPTQAGSYTIYPTLATVTPSGNTSKYTFTYFVGTFTINRKPVTVTAANKTKVYSRNASTDPPLTFVPVGLISPDALSGSLTRVTGENVGTYAINQGTVNNTSNPNYDITFVSETFEITKKTITVTLDNQTKMYGDSDPVFTYTSAGLISPDVLSGTPTRVPGQDRGTYTISPGNPADVTPGLSGGDNYTISGSIGNGTLTIIAREITVQAADSFVTYGDSLGTNSVELAVGSSLAFSDTLTGASFAYSTAEPKNIGTYTITASLAQFGGGGSAANYIISYVTGTLTINARPITITAGTRSVDYGDALGSNSASLTTGSLAYEDVLGVVTYTYNVATPVNAGTYSITPSDAVISAGRQSNYNISYVAGVLTIVKRNITVTVNPASKIFGANDPAFTYSLDAGSLKSGDALSLVRVTGANVGTYAITLATTTTNSNYNITSTDSNLTINPKPIMVTAAAKTKTYGEADPELTYTTDPVGFTVELERASVETVGTYAITQKSSTANNNFIITYTGANLTINARPITVKAVNQTVEYGTALPTNGFTLTSGSMASDDILTATYSYEGGGTPSNRGTYSITPGGFSVTGNRESNYTITPDNGTLTITTRAIAITANSPDDITYGQSLPANGFTLSSGSLVGSDAISGVTYTYSTATPVNAGSYTITPSAATFNLGSADNYDITYNTGTLTIKRKDITVTAEAKTKVYGADEQLTPLTFTVVGLERGETTLNGALTRVSGEDVRTYAINEGTVTNVSNPNYNISYINTGVNFVITKKDITVTAVSKSKVFGNDDPALTFTVSGLERGETTLNGSLSRADRENVGSYAISADTVNNDNNPNYNITSFTPANLTITRRAITVTPDANQKMEYGSLDPTLTYKVYDTTAPSTPITLALSGSLERATGTNVGNYAITQGSVTSTSNYEITFTANVQFEITKRAITVRAVTPTAITYGENNPVSTWELSSGAFLGADTISSVAFTYSVFTLVVATPVSVGTYTITPSAAVLVSGSVDNYEVSYATGTLTINRKLITVKPVDKVGYFGDPLPTNELEITSGGLAFDDALGTVNYVYTPIATPVDPGDYTITPSGLVISSGKDSNYTISYNTGTLKIEAAFAGSIVPDRGFYLGDTPFTITGLGFGPPGTVATVRFYVARESGTPTFFATQVVVVNSTTITGFTPPWDLLDPEMPEIVDVEVKITTGFGVKTGVLDQAYTYLPPIPVPEVNAVEPLTGPSTGGTTTTLFGRNLIGTDGEMADVYINGQLSTNGVINFDGTELTVTIPPNASGQMFDIDVFTDVGASGFVSIFEYYPPVVDEVIEPRGYTVGGTRVRVVGRYFGSQTGEVFFGSNKATVISWSLTDITVDTPPGAVGKVAVRVVPATGPDTASKSDAYEYVEPPTGAVTGVIWLDLNKNGIFDSGSEPILPNINVSLTLQELVLPPLTGVSATSVTSSSALVRKSSVLDTRTDAEGKYRLPDRMYGNYVLKYIVPSDFTTTYEPDGAKDGVLRVSLQAPEVKADVGGVGNSSLEAIVVDTNQTLQTTRNVMLRWAGADQKMDTQDDVLIPYITSKSGKVSFNQSLPAGKYRIEATSRGRSIKGNTLTLKANGKLSGAVFVLPSRITALPVTGASSLTRDVMSGIYLVLLGGIFTTNGRVRRRKV